MRGPVVMLSHVISKLQHAVKHVAVPALPALQEVNKGRHLHVHLQVEQIRMKDGCCNDMESIVTNPIQ